MADISNNEKDRIGIEHVATGNDLVVNSDGSINVKGLSITLPSVIAISDYTNNGKLFSVADNMFMTSAGVDNPIVLIKNPSGSGKVFYLYRTAFGINVENIYGNFKMFKNPTVTANGTALTIVNNRISGSETSSMLAYKLPTVSSNGTRIGSYIVAQNASSLITNEDFAIQLEPNNSILITGDPKSNSREAVITITWAEDVES